ncbi:MAG: N-6 DNA methylase [Spirochaetales bacterium]
MLDTNTKRRIDTARDILVGKVPDPKSQVEQITIALIYKFMDDMDAESEELGGVRSFFAGDFARYGWAKLMRSGLGGHETLNLYAEAISRMPENPGIPALFRDIFKNAYLPYRDPETLRVFLKVIDEFSYDHSERLGDAFEYLLSVLGSQGDAGQFRTPRHIIDFMVKIVDPQKDEKVLDPACGTAGFLISSYKHIIASNKDEKGDSTLTPDEKAQLARNFTGYDISPDMVRLSLVNMYLHGFIDPHIYEYDTLTSQERWNEYADVILANPPFMSPKGGIRPHNRFSVQSKRSEVLFVDYMAEHLRPNGRAAIIVPEGIIFQSQGAYVQLRKMLVDDYLVAVVSLPAGVFNPYSGVKTSILILDKELAKRSSTIGFFKVENDGFGLGAQRREIEKNDLPAATVFLKSLFQSIPLAFPTSSAPAEPPLPSGTLIVPRATISANGDYNLSGERYQVGVVSQTSWPLVTVAEAFCKSDKSILPESLDGPITYIGLENLTQNTGEITGDVVTSEPATIKSLKNIFKPCDILYGKLRPNLNKVWLADRAGICSTDIFVIQAMEGKADPALYSYLFRSKRFNETVICQLRGAQLPRIGWSSFGEIQIPLPPLEVQKGILAEIEGYQKVIDGARAVTDNYHPHIAVHPSWPMVELKEVCEIRSGGTPSRIEDSYWNGNIPWVGSTVCKDREVTKAEEYITEAGLNNSAAKLFPKNTTLIALVGATIGKTGLLMFESTTNQNIAGLYPISKKALEPVYLFHAVQQLYPAFMKLGEGKFRMANLSFVREQKIYLPPISTQRAIVAEIEAEQKLVDANRELITRFEKKIQAVLARVWGESDEQKEEQK